MTPEDLGPRVLEGRFVRLEPLVPAHKEGLRRAGSDPAIWRYMPVRDGELAFEDFWNTAEKEMAARERIAFAVRRLAEDVLVGSTSYLNIAPEHARCEIGWTWYEPAAQATAINPEAKLLLLANAFENAGCVRVELRTEAGNARSRAAILKLGATEEGILRRHMRMPRGYWRDTVYYSVLVDEWPAVKAKLLARLG
ncbi:MAG: GNAT family N-acetyltransferase [Alphaproteobacteria bacterium]